MEKRKVEVFCRRGSRENVKEGGSEGKSMKGSEGSEGLRKPYIIIIIIINYYFLSVRIINNYLTFHFSYIYIYLSIYILRNYYELI